MVLGTSVLFVFYKLNERVPWSCREYPPFPGEWQWTGMGSTRDSTYPMEDQYNGNEEDKEGMRELLRVKCESLKEQDFMHDYRIEDFYIFAKI